MTILAAELDLMVVKKMYKALSQLVKQLPKIFVNLSRAVVRFAARV